MFIIESIRDVTENEKGDQFYNVKWFGYPEEACTVEPAENIPDFIKDFYSDKNNIGKKLQNPKIRTTRKLDGVAPLMTDPPPISSDNTTYHFLTWDGEAGGER